MDKSNFWRSRKINDHINSIKGYYTPSDIMVNYFASFMGCADNRGYARFNMVHSRVDKFNQVW